MITDEQLATLSKEDPAAYLRRIQVPFGLAGVKDLVILKALEAAGHIEIIDENPLIIFAALDRSEAILNGRKYVIAHQAGSLRMGVFDFGIAK